MKTPSRYLSGLWATLSIMLLSALSCSADSITRDEVFHQGNQAFIDGQFDEAIRCYQMVLEQDGVSPSLFYNLANAYQETGKQGLAILNYERALWLAPRDPHIRASAQAARNGKTQDRFEASWTRAFLRFNLAQWTWATSVAWGLIGTVSLVSGLGFRRLGCKRVTLPLALTLVISGSGMAYHLRQLDRAVVLHDDVALRQSPFDGAEPIAALEEGHMVRVKKTHGEFVNVTTEADQTGWAAAQDLERVVPSGVGD